MPIQQIKFEKKLTFEQQNDLAKELGIILPGMTKQDVIETYTELFLQKVWYTSDGQEVWHYDSPEEQNIFFKDDKVEKIEYIHTKKKKYKTVIDERIEM